MNKQLIEELATQADLLDNFTPTKVSGHYAGIITVTSIEKFAELIVQECIDICNKNTESNANKSAVDCYYAIRTRFGIND